MSVEEVERTIKLDKMHPFNHSVVLKPEIKMFRNAFKQKNSSKEFEAFLSKDHKMYEANETPVLNFLESGATQSIVNDLLITAKCLQNLSKPLLKKDELHNVDLLKMSQADIYKMAVEMMNKSHEAMEKIIETE